MYIPKAFEVTDLSCLQDFIEAHSFGMLISTRAHVPFVTHLPFLLDRAAGPNGYLLGHLARANPHGHSLEGEQVLVVFAGPHAYISPSWYEADNVVPTWNYVAVHAYGTLRLIEDATEVMQLLSRTVTTYESGFPEPWSFDPTTDFARRLAGAVVGLRIEIAHLEGKWKLSQNHPPERQQKVIRALQRQRDPEAQTIARFMEERLRRDE